MSSISSSTSRTTPLYLILGVIVVALFIAAVVGLNESLGLSDTVAFWGLFAVGFTLCAIGPLSQGTRFGWWNPLHIVGYVVGVLILLLGGAVLFDIAVPGVASLQSAILVLAGLMLVKGVIGMFYGRVKRTG